MPSTDADYPEHAKLEAVQKLSQAIGEFLEWAFVHHGAQLCELSTEQYEAGRYVPVWISTNNLLAEHFGIDQHALEQEKRRMLDEIRPPVDRADDPPNPDPREGH